MNRKHLETAVEVQEEADYVNAAVCTVEKKEVTSGQKFLSFARRFAAVAVCWLILSVIVALQIYFTTVISEKNTKLTEENQQLETQINDMKTEWNELNVSRAQWSIDAYCPKENNVRECKPCDNGWSLSESSCFEFNGPPSDHKTWEEARENCREKGSDLAVVANEAEKDYIRDRGVDSQSWIGLRAEGGEWKWLDGSHLANTSWIQQQPADDGHCVISVYKDRWESVNCDEKQQWICQKKVLSV